MKIERGEGLEREARRLERDADEHEELAAYHSAEARKARAMAKLYREGLIGPK